MSEEFKYSLVEADELEEKDVVEDEPAAKGEDEEEPVE